MGSITELQNSFYFKKKVGLKRKVGVDGWMLLKTHLKVGFPQVFNNPGPKIFYDI